MPAPHHSIFYRPDALPDAKPKGLKHRRQIHRLFNALQTLVAVSYCPIHIKLHHEPRFHSFFPYSRWAWFSQFHSVFFLSMSLGISTTGILWAWWSSCHPSNSVKAPSHWKSPTCLILYWSPLSDSWRKGCQYLWPSSPLPLPPWNRHVYVFKTRALHQVTLAHTSTHKLWLVHTSCGWYTLAVVDTHKLWLVHTSCGQYTQAMVGTH